MSIQGLGSPFSQGISGVTGIARTEEERRQSRKTSEDNAALDPRASFNADIDSLLGDASGVRPASGQLSPTSQASQTGIAAGTAGTGDSFRSSTSDADPGTYTARGRLKTQTAPTVTTGAAATGSTLASEPAVVPAGADTGSDEKDEKDAGAADQLSAEEEKQVEKLRQRDQEVRAHEQAHQATGGEHAGGASYTYQRGPDNRQYAIGGSVPIDVSPIPDDPDATVAKAEKVRAAAMAPASPSGADQQVAAKASQMASKARAEQAEKALNPEKDDESGAIGQSAQSGKADTSDKAEKIGEADKADKIGEADTSDKLGQSGKLGEADTDQANPGTASSPSDPAAPSSLARTEKAAESGLLAQTTSLTPTAQTTQSAQSGSADSPADTAEPGVSAASGLHAANPLQLSPPRPAEATAAMPETRSDPRSDAAPAQSSAYAALQQLGQAAAETVQTRTTADDRTMNRAMSRATAAYARVRGETGLAPANTGISMAV